MSLGAATGAQIGGGVAFAVKAEARVATGAPGLSIVGLADRAVGESRERVLAALETSSLLSLASKAAKVVVSLSPADQKKSGSHLDLAIAVACLSAAKIVPSDSAYAFIGELGLDGTILPSRGTLAMAEAVSRAGVSKIIVPFASCGEAAAIPNLIVYGAKNLREVVAHLSSRNLIQRATPISLAGRGFDSTPSYDTARNQKEALRAAEIAVAGGHSFAMVGPPGTGKTTVAHACAEIMPPLSEDEAVEVARVASLSGLPVQVPIKRPFRSPHHTATYAALVGGGQNLNPGEVAKAHRGVLFLDELPEFDRRALDALREPLEEGLVRIARASGSASFPARFTLIAAMNPCPCGFAGDSQRECQCPPGVAARYGSKISGPVADRIDVWARVRPPPSEDVVLASSVDTKDGSAAQKRVSVARLAQKQRAVSLGLPTWTTNAELPDAALRSEKFSDEARESLAFAAKKLQLSARGITRSMRVSRTVADLEGSALVLKEHVLEAISHRNRRQA